MGMFLLSTLLFAATFMATIYVIFELILIVKYRKNKELRILHAKRMLIGFIIMVVAIILDIIPYNHYNKIYENKVKTENAIKFNHPLSNGMQGKWTNDNGDMLTIKNSNAELMIANGKKQGTYNFKVKSKNNYKYVLKPEGKKMDKTSKYSLLFNNKSIAEFKYGKHKITFNSQEVEVTKNNVRTVPNDKDTNKSVNKNATTLTSQTDAPQANTAPQASQSDNNQQSSQSQTNNDNTQKSSNYDVYTNPQMYSNRGF
ncbi:hypothetical protein ACQW5G_01370 [Fructilactobacillus sp. Tb1]|uniref:hypothetical protein n=1 Tax=Fructilactobacillus sp. Tb1 TaxID=3422304 RepID=UPI003D2A17C8